MVMKQGGLCEFCIPYKGSNKIFYHLKNCDVEGYKYDKNNCPNHHFKPTATVVLGIGRCDECPYIEKTSTPRAGFAFDYWCKACLDENGNPRKIAGYIEYDSGIPPVPSWCPFKIKEDEG